MNTHQINRALINICTDDIEVSKSFYTSLFDFTIQFDSNWFVQLKSTSIGYEIALIDINNELVPKQMRNQASGFYLTFVVVDVYHMYAQLLETDTLILQKPEDTF